MDDAFLVRGLESIGDLLRGFERFIDRHRPAHETFGQRLAFDQLHHEEMAPLSFLEAVQGGNVGMAQRREDLGFALEACETIGVGGQRVRQHLDRNRASELRVAGPVDLAHATRAQERQDLVRAESCADGDGHPECCRIMSDYPQDSRAGGQWRSPEGGHYMCGGCPAKAGHYISDVRVLER